VTAPYLDVDASVSSSVGNGDAIAATTAASVRTTRGSIARGVEAAPPPPLLVTLGDTARRDTQWVTNHDRVGRRARTDVAIAGVRSVT
jgi:hypothetical protein